MSFISDAVRFPLVLGLVLLLTSLPDPAYADCEEQQLGLSFPGTGYGDAVAIDGNTAVVGASGYDIPGVNNAGAVFVHVFDGTDWEQQALLVTETPEVNEFFGGSVAIDGDVLVAKASEIGTVPGSVYVFTRSGTNWTQLQQLTPWDGATGVNFGYRIALDGDYLAVGAPAGIEAAGAVYVYHWDGTAWVQDERLQSAEPAVLDDFGESLSLRGNELVIAPDLDNNVIVFRRDAGGWTQTATLDPIFNVHSVAFDGTTIIAGSAIANAGQGLATIWEWQGEGWSLPQQIMAEDSVYNYHEGFGSDVAIAGDVAIVGAGGQDTIDECNRREHQNVGALYWFSREATGWKQVAKTTPVEQVEFGRVGSRLAFSSDSTLLVGRSRNGTALVFDALPVPDCNENGVSDACETADVDCNENGIPDDCDIDSGLSVDCNGNVIPDECERDCNANGVPDDCDLTAGTSTDCDENNIPDECDYPQCDVGGMADVCDPGAQCVPSAGCLLAWRGANSSNYLSALGVSIGDGYAFAGSAWGGRAFAYRQDGADWVLDGELTVPGQALGLFGEHVAVHGTTGFIQDGTLTHVMRRGAGGWYHDTTIPSLFGPFAFDGTHLVGYFGASRVVLAEDGGVWDVVAVLQVSDPSADGGGVAIDGDTIVIGPFVFEHNGTTWVETAQLERFGPEDLCHTVPALGRSVSVSQDTIAIGDDLGTDYPVPVPVYVYRKTNGTWAPEARFEYSDDFSRVAVEGDSLIVANRRNVFIHRRNGTAWSPRAEIEPPFSVASNELGYFVAIDSGVVLAADTLAWFYGAGSDCNLNGIADQCDIANGISGTDTDADGDSVLDYCDFCDGGDDTVDSDGDGVPDDCDPCPFSNPDDDDGDGVCGFFDICPEGDDSIDTDGDGVPDACDPCPNGDDTADSDGDGVCDSLDACPGSDDAIDSDGDGVPDACDACDNNIPGACTLVPLTLAGPSHDLMKNRYLSVDPRGTDLSNAGQDFDIRVTLSSTLVNGVTAVGSSWWANAPDVNCISIVGPTQPIAPINWDACPTLHLTGCPIMPTSTYDIVPVLGGLQFGPALVAETQAKPGDGKWWGDTVGFYDAVAQEWTPPQGSVNIDDAVAAMKTFQDPDAPNATHMSVTDVHPNDPTMAPPFDRPNLIVNIDDVFQIILGFQGNEYPGPEIHLCVDP